MLYCLLLFSVGCRPAAETQAIPNAKTMAATAAESLYEEAWQSLQRDFIDDKFNGQDWYRWKTHYRGRLHDEEDAYVAIATMVSSLNDDYTRFLPPRDMKEQTLYIDSKLYGVGLQITVRDNQLRVVSAIQGTPAAEQDFKPGDVITHVNGESMAGLSVEECADKIRGPEGTPVRLSVRREDRLFDVTLERAEIKIQSVFSRELPVKDIAYIRLNSFMSERALDEMKEALSKVQDKKALVLDLRGNYGGLLSNAVEIADLFLKKGVIVSVKGRRSEYESAYSALPDQVFDKPMAVLIDGGSASASEILSAALQENGRAALVGSTTFGKGLVQKITPLEQGAGLNITISKYLTPQGHDINRHGIRPDVSVALSPKDFELENDAQLAVAVKQLSKQVGVSLPAEVSFKFP